MQGMNSKPTRPFSLCVYCGSSPGTDARFRNAAQEVGAWIGAQGAQLVYGGGGSGLMGLVAEAALEAGAHVIGVIPQSMVRREWAKQDCTELHVVENMHTRKQMMAERADAFVALPGGIGTFEELFETWTWRQLGYHDKPIGLLNVAGHYDALLSAIESSVQAGFLTAEVAKLLCVMPEVAPLLSQLRAQAERASTDTRYRDI